MGNGNNKTQNEVRQVLMNEMGLTRESIREEIRSIVKETAESYLRGDQFRQTVDRMLATAISDCFKEGRYDQNALKRMITEGVQRNLMARFDISITTKV